MEIINEFEYLLKSSEDDEDALVFLYDKLISIIQYPKKCDNFLKEIWNKEFLNSDCFIHILSVLIKIKTQLKYWNQFVKHSREKVCKEVGIETTELLFKFID